MWQGHSQKTVCSCGNVWVHTVGSILCVCVCVVAAPGSSTALCICCIRYLSSVTAHYTLSDAVDSSIVLLHWVFIQLCLHLCAGANPSVSVYLHYNPVLRGVRAASTNWDLVHLAAAPQPFLPGWLFSSSEDFFVHLSRNKSGAGAGGYRCAHLIQRSRNRVENRPY